MHRIVLAEPLIAAAEARLAAGATVLRPPAGDPEALAELLADADALIVRTHTPVTRALLERAPRLKVVGVAGVGLDQVDSAAAAELCITVINRPAAATEAVADLTVALLLNLLRPIERLSSAYRSGEFRAARAQPHGDELHTRTIGIFGMGRIGSRVGRILSAGFGCPVLYHDIAAVGPFDFAATSVSFAELLARADVLSLHVPLTDRTRNRFDAATLAQLRSGALLINTARGALVATAALTAALESGHLAGAGLDVVTPEPLPPDHALWQSDRCLLTPHIAARTHGGIECMCGVVDDVLAMLDERRRPRTAP